MEWGGVNEQLAVLISGVWQWQDRCPCRAGAAPAFPSSEILWAGSLPFFLDNISGSVRNAVGFGLRMRFLILGFPLWEAPGVFQVCLGLNFGTNRFQRNNLAPPRWLRSPEPLLPHAGRALWCPSSQLDLYRIPGIPWCPHPSQQWDVPWKVYFYI